jgi:transposase, IS5 family
VVKRPDARTTVHWHVATRQGKRRALDVDNASIDALVNRIEQLKVSVRSKVEHLFRVMKRQLDHVKVHYRGLAKNTALLKTLFALRNLWMVRHVLAGKMRLQQA